MINRHSKRPVIFPDGHLNIYGHSLMSEIIHRELKNLKWLK